MIRTDELKGLIAKKGFSQKYVAECLGITAKTLYLKMKSGVFNSTEIHILIDLLDIENVMEIFFAK